MLNPQNDASGLRLAPKRAMTLVLMTAVIIAAGLAHAQTFTVLYSFKGEPNDGAGPLAGLIEDTAGNLYGTTQAGGPANSGTVFKLDQAGNETILYTFTGGSDGGFPEYGSLLRDPAGNLYGTTLEGGAASYGTVFRVSKTGKETVLHSFPRNQNDGEGPTAGLLPISRQIAVGTTESGGAFRSGCQGVGCGTVFELDASGREKVLYSFTGGTDGSVPLGGLVEDRQGNLYGTTNLGGMFGLGTVFKLNRKGNETVLHSFAGSPTDGEYPIAGLVLDGEGNLYGTTPYGGPAFEGTIFKVDSTGNETVLYSFIGYPNDGEFPYAALVRDTQGNLYGTTQSGGANNFGTVFELSSTSKETVLHNFVYFTDGANPYGSLIRDLAGNLYGTTSTAGPACCGTVFKLTP